MRAYCVVAAAGNYRDRDMLAIEQLRWTEHMPPPEVLRDTEQDLSLLVQTEI